MLLELNDERLLLDADEALEDRLLLLGDEPLDDESLDELMLELAAEEDDMLELGLEARGSNGRDSKPKLDGMLTARV